MSDTTVTPQQFGATGDGATDDTSAFIQFLAACEFGEALGYIPAGRYVVKAGQLVISTTGAEHRPGPRIETAGHEAVQFLLAGDDDAPLLTIHNGTAAGPAGRFLGGGALGGFTVSEHGSNRDPSWCGRHALQIAGTQSWQFGRIIGKDLSGDTVRIERRLYMDNGQWQHGNPDPHHVALCSFRGIEAYRSKGWALNNDNGQGFTGNQIDFVRAIDCEHGALRTTGGGNQYGTLSASGNKGWVVHFYSDSVFGTWGRDTILVGELDGNEYGIWVETLDHFELRRLRQKIRGAIAGSVRVPQGEVWPKIGVRVSSAGEQNDDDPPWWPRVSRGVIECEFRVADALAADALTGRGSGTTPRLLDLQGSAGIRGLDMRVDLVSDHELVDDQGLALTSESLLRDAPAEAEIHASAEVVITSGRGETLYDSTPRETAVLTAWNGAQGPELPTGGFTSSQARLVFDKVRYDKTGIVTGAKDGVEIRAGGLYRIQARLTTDAGEDPAVRIKWRTALMVNQQWQQQRTLWVTAGERCDCNLGLTAFLQAGDVVWVSSDASPGPIRANPLAPYDNLLVVEKVG